MHRRSDTIETHLYPYQLDIFERSNEYPGIHRSVRRDKGVWLVQKSYHKKPPEDDKSGAWMGKKSESENV